MVSKRVLGFSVIVLFTAGAVGGGGSGGGGAGVGVEESGQPTEFTGVPTAVPGHWS